MILLAFLAKQGPPISHSTLLSLSSPQLSTRNPPPTFTPVTRLPQSSLPSWLPFRLIMTTPPPPTTTTSDSGSSASNSPSWPQENVWEYARPPSISPNRRLVVIKDADGVVLAQSKQGFVVRETSHPPSYYIPKDDFKQGVLQVQHGGNTFCEWKGTATYYKIRGVDNAAWSYDNPTESYVQLAGHVSVYANRVHEVTVDGVVVVPQAGDFYGGWILPGITGGARGFKGGPGTWGW